MKGRPYVKSLSAAVSVAENLLKGPHAKQVAPGLIEPLKKAAQVAANAELARRAKAALQQAQTRTGEK